MKFGLSDPELRFVISKLIDPLKKAGAKVWVFGSRARGDHRPFSDLDILFELPTQAYLPTGFLSELKEIMEESRFPYKVDLVNVDELAESYVAGVVNDRVEI